MSWPTPHSEPPSPRRSALSTTAVLGAAVYILLLLSLCAASPLLIYFLPKPELAEWYPPNIMCATCEEIERQNPVLLEYTNNGVGKGCRGVGNYWDQIHVNVTFGGMKRCWVREKGKDEWLRPVGWNRENVVKYRDGMQEGRGGS